MLDNTTMQVLEVIVVPIIAQLLPVAICAICHKYNRKHKKQDHPHFPRQKERTGGLAHKGRS